MNHLLHASLAVTRRPVRSSTVVVLSVLTSLHAMGCRRGDSVTVENTQVIVDDSGIVVADLQSIADYLSLPEVQEIFQRMPRYDGSSPPDILGRYESDDQEITFTTIPGSAIGDLLARTVFCFSAAVGGEIDASIEDASVVDGGARYFVEGTGNAFTVYFAHKSLQVGTTGATCELQLVRIFSGVRENDGSFSELDVGVAVVGLVGDCGNLLVGDVQISTGTGVPIGGSCFFNNDPVDPTKVLVNVENSLITDLDVFLSNDGFQTDEVFVPVNPEGSAQVEKEPGFELYFESLPVADSSTGAPMGEILFKLFEPDITAAGGTVTYVIENDIDGNLFFAPIITNDTADDLLPSVNIGIPDTPEGWFCDGCFIASGETAFIGYYAYDILGELDDGTLFEWTPFDVNIGFFLDGAIIPDDPALVVIGFEDPVFALEPSSGVIGLLLPDDASPVVLP